MKMSMIRAVRVPAVLLALILVVQTGAASAQETVAALAQRLADPRTPVATKTQICERLMEMGPAAAPATSALVTLLKSDSPDLRDSAVTTLTRIGPGAREALPALTAMSRNDPSPNLRSLAESAVRKIGGGAVPPAAPPAPPPAGRPQAPMAGPAHGRQGATPPASLQARATARPVLFEQQGQHFAWAVPDGWRGSDTMAGVELVGPDGVTVVQSALLMRTPGSTTPRDFLMRCLAIGAADIKVLAVRDLPAIMSGYRIPWQSQEYDVTYQARGRALRATWVVGVVNVMGVSYDAYVMSYEAPPNTFDQSALYLAAIAHTIRATGPVGGHVLLPQNHPLDNSALIESWRQKGLSEDRISQARREGTMGYERMYDAQTGHYYNMPLETYDGTVGGYRNPARPNEILVKPKAGY